MSEEHEPVPPLSGFTGTEAEHYAVAADAALPDPMLSARLASIEADFPQVVDNLRQIGALVTELRSSVMFLSQQRAVAELQFERNTRSMALDLAIKAAPGADGTALTTLGDAFLKWIKATSA